MFCKYFVQNCRCSPKNFCFPMLNRNPGMSFVLVNFTGHTEASLRIELFTGKTQGALAQLVARQYDDPKVVCSIPTSSFF